MEKLDASLKPFLCQSPFSFALSFLEPPLSTYLEVPCFFHPFSRCSFQLQILQAWEQLQPVPHNHYPRQGSTECFELMVRIQAQTCFFIIIICRFSHSRAS